MIHSDNSPIRFNAVSNSWAVASKPTSNSKRLTWSTPAQKWIGSEMETDLLLTLWHISHGTVHSVLACLGIWKWSPRLPSHPRDRRRCNVGRPAGWHIPHTHRLPVGKQFWTEDGKNTSEEQSEFSDGGSSTGHIPGLCRSPSCSEPYTRGDMAYTLLPQLQTPVSPCKVMKCSF